MRTSTPPLVTVVVLVTAVLAACSGSPSSSSSGSSGDRSASSSPGASASSSAAGPSPTRVAVPPAPKPAGCYRLTAPQLTKPTNGSPTVPCTGRHTARTIFVGRLDTVVDGHSVSVDSSHVQRQLSTTCPAKLAAYVGGTPATRDLSRFNVVWYSPSLGQSDRGAGWFRCDLVAFGKEQQLAALPPTGLRGALTRAGGLDRFGLCGTAAPGTPGFQRVICGQPHGWRAFATIALSGGADYPGADTVRKAGDAECRGRVRAQSSASLKFRYGWEWPTQEQWRAGQHFGYCWQPV